MSTHWPLFMKPDGQSVSDEEYQVVSSAFERYLLATLPDPRTHKLYFDHGSETLDSIYARYQERVDRVVARQGYRHGVDWLTRSFPGQKHNEISWASRIDVPLTFLLAPAGRGAAQREVRTPIAGVDSHRAPASTSLGSQLGGRK